MKVSFPENTPPFDAEFCVEHSRVSLRYPHTSEVEPPAALTVADSIALAREVLRQAVRMGYLKPGEEHVQ